MDFSLPLVSIVIVNYNYGHLLRQAIESVRAQSYPEIECIVVDDASTDSSRDLLDEIKAADPTLVVLHRAVNGGQNAAVVDGFRQSHGQYVVFLDSDDVLLPDFVLTHVFVHLSLRVHVGVTTSDVLQTADDRIVVSTGESFNRHIRAAGGPDRNLTRPIGESLRSIACFDQVDRTVLDLLYFIPPGHAHRAWSPTSANFFRRDALDLIIDARKLCAARGSPDAFLCAGAAGLCGSVLIDRALSFYRMHGGNMASGRVQLHGVSGMRPGEDRTGVALDALIDHLTREDTGLASRVWDHDGYLDLIDGLRRWKRDIDRRTARQGPLWRSLRRFLRPKPDRGC